ncbi:MAG: hypothetical protein MR011_06370 [Lachnospiraceae bacterium]|nr:hypothetical protein [Lachnospiraceae bacterium]
MREFILHWWLQAIFAVVLSAIGYIVQKLSKKFNQEVTENAAMKTAMIAILHDRLFQLCQTYIKLGYIPIDDAERILDNLDMLYSAYSALGGNGTGTALYNRAKALPLRAAVCE